MYILVNYIQPPASPIFFSREFLKVLDSSIKSLPIEIENTVQLRCHPAYRALIWSHERTLWIIHYNWIRREWGATCKTPFNAEISSVKPLLRFYFSSVYMLHFELIEISRSAWASAADGSAKWVFDEFIFWEYSKRSP